MNTPCGEPTVVDATNTDVVGIVESLRLHLPAGATRALLLGAGATARSAVLALADLGITTLTVRARHHKAADLLVLGPRVGRRDPQRAGGRAWPVAEHPGRRRGLDLLAVAADAVAATVPQVHHGILLDVGYAGVAHATKGRALPG